MNKATAQNLFLTATLLLTTVSFTQCASYKEKMDAAIKSSDLPMVKKMIKRYGELDPALKQEYVEDAEDLWEERKKKVSLANPWDLSKFLGGLVITGVMATVMTSDDVNRNGGRRRDPATAGVRFLSLVGACYGVYLTARGFSCSYAKERVAEARKIYDEIKKAQEKQSAEQIATVQQKV